MNVFYKAFNDLKSAIDRFEVLAREGKIFGRSNENIFTEAETTVQKELFAAANAAHSLQDHSTRRLQKRINIDGYRDQLQTCFSTDGLHDFIVGLRKIIHHLRMQPANWSVTKNVWANPEIQAKFQLDKKELMLLSHELNSTARKYLENAPEKINIREIFEEYGQRASAFHSWLSGAIAAAPLETLRDYERCLNENKKVASRTFWKAMIGNWVNADNPPNPYEYLDRYLTSSQLEAVARLPHGSEKQINQIIQFVDRYGACDDELRGLVHRLFNKTSS